MADEIPQHLFAQTEPRIDINVEIEGCEEVAEIGLPELLLSLSVGVDGCDNTREVIFAWTDVEIREWETEDSLTLTNDEPIRISGDDE